MRVATVFAFAVMIAANACATEPNPGPPPYAAKSAATKGDDDSTGTKTKKTPKKTATGDLDDALPDDTASDPAPASKTPATATMSELATKCAAEATGDACNTCCIGDQQAQLQPWVDAFNACICGSGDGNCGDECITTQCAGQAPSDACQQCMDASTICDSKGEAACAADASCKPIGDCHEAACKSKEN